MMAPPKIGQDVALAGSCDRIGCVVGLVVCSRGFAAIQKAVEGFPSRFSARDVEGLDADRLPADFEGASRYLNEVELDGGLG